VKQPLQLTLEIPHLPQELICFQGIALSDTVVGLLDQQSHASSIILSDCGGRLGSELLFKVVFVFQARSPVISCQHHFITESNTGLLLAI
jgi:hypothetical protein